MHKNLAVSSAEENDSIVLFTVGHSRAMRAPLRHLLTESGLDGRFCRGERGRCIAAGARHRGRGDGPKEANVRVRVDDPNYFRITGFIPAHGKNDVALPADDVYRTVDHVRIRHFFSFDVNLESGAAYTSA